MSYVKIARDFAGHSTVDHRSGQYVRDGVTTNQAETFFSQLKRSIDGDAPPRQPRAPHRYLAEFDYRFSTCKVSDTERMARLARQVGHKRLTYRTPTRGE